MFPPNCQVRRTKAEYPKQTADVVWGDIREANLQLFVGSCVFSHENAYANPSIPLPGQADDNAF